MPPVTSTPWIPLDAPGRRLRARLGRTPTTGSGATRRKSARRSAAATVVGDAPRPKSPNVWAVAGLAGAIGALLTAGLIAAAGGFSTRELPVRSVEHVAVGHNVSAACWPRRRSRGRGGAEAASRRSCRSPATRWAARSAGQASSSATTATSSPTPTSSKGESNVKVIAADGRTLAAEDRRQRRGHRHRGAEGRAPTCLRRRSARCRACR